MISCSSSVLKAITAATMDKPKRPRNDLTVAQKQEICRYYQEHPDLTIKALQIHFSKSFGIDIGHSTIGRIVNRAEHWNSIEFPNNVRRTSSTTFVNMERAVFDWICSASEPVSEDEITRKISELVENSDMQSELKAQKGWLNSFKRRFNLIQKCDDHAKPIGYIAGKMPDKREPLSRVKASRGRRSSSRTYAKTPASQPEINHTSTTNSIIYDAALGNFLQDDCDDDDDIEMSGDGTRVKENKSRTLVSPSNQADHCTTSQMSENGATVSSTATCTVPVILHAGWHAETESSPVHISSAQKALSTLETFFRQNSDAVAEDLEHLKALDVRLKYLSAKAAVKTLKSHLMDRDRTRDSNEADLQYLTDLDQRL